MQLIQCTHYAVNTHAHMCKYTEKLYYTEYKKLIMNISPYKYIEKYIKHTKRIAYEKAIFKSFVMRECSHGFINPIPRIGDQRKD